MASKSHHTPSEHRSTGLDPEPASDRVPQEVGGKTGGVAESASVGVGDPVQPPLNFVGLGLRLPRQRNRPRGSVERVGSRPEKWRGIYYVYVVENGIEKRVQRRPVLGSTASMSKRQAQDKLAEIVERELAQPLEMPRRVRFRDVWENFCTLKSGVWGKANQGNLRGIFKSHVLPLIGDAEITQLSPDPLQRLLNQVAARGYRKSTLKHIRTYLRAALEYAIDEGLINRNPARKLELPKTQRSRSRFYSFAEIDKLLAASSGRENIVFRILLFCGLRPAELLALRIEDVGENQLRIDEAVKEKEKGEKRIGETKTETSDAWVSLPPELARDLEAWVSAHPRSADPKAFLFPTAVGTAYRVGNFLKRVLKPIAKTAGIDDFDFRAMRATASTLFQGHGSVKDTQGQMRHADPSTTLRYYVKVIPENQRKAVADFERWMTKKSRPETLSEAERGGEVMKG